MIQKLNLNLIKKPRTLRTIDKTANWMVNSTVFVLAPSKIGIC